MEYWVEVNIFSIELSQEKIVDKVVRSIIEELSNKFSCHFLYESNSQVNRFLPHIRLRVEAKSEEEKLAIKERLNSVLGKFNVTYFFGKHGTKNEDYIGESDRFGEKGWLLIKKLLETCSLIALGLEEKDGYGPRFCRVDIFHLIANIFGRRNFTENQPLMMILLEDMDIPTKKNWEGA